MNPQDGTKPPPLPRKSRGLVKALVIVGCFLLLPAALLIWYASVRISNASAIERLEAEVTQRGEPLTLAELPARYPDVPDEENAAVALIEAWMAEDPTYWTAFLNDNRPLPVRNFQVYHPALPYLGEEAGHVPRTKPLDSNSLSVAESYLIENAAHLEQVHAALQRSLFQFPVNLEDGPSVLLPHLASLKLEALRFEIAALIDAERGNFFGALTNIQDTVRIGELLAKEPLLISQLIRAGCQTLAMNSIEQLLSRNSLKSEELNTLREVLEGMEIKRGAYHALIYERPYSLCAFDPEMAAKVASSNSVTGSDAAGIKVRQLMGWTDMDKRFMLETFSEAIALAEQETPESLKRIEELFDEVTVEARKFPPKVFSVMMLPAFAKISARFAALEARRRASLVAVAVEQYRLEHDGTLPETLDDIVPDYLSAIPSDPFDGQPIRFRKLEPGYVVYSVGEDRENNGGTERLKTAANHTDVTFFVER